MTKSSISLFDDLGFDSINITEIIMAVEEQFKVKIAVDTVAQKIESGSLGEFVILLKQNWKTE